MKNKEFEEAEIVDRATIGADFERMMKVYIAIIVGLAISPCIAELEAIARSRDPFGWCIIHLEAKLIGVPVLGRLCDFIDDIWDRWTRRNE